MSLCSRKTPVVLYSHGKCSAHSEHVQQPEKLDVCVFRFTFVYKNVPSPELHTCPSWKKKKFKLVFALKLNDHNVKGCVT